MVFICIREASQFLWPFLWGQSPIPRITTQNRFGTFTDVRLLAPLGANRRVKGGCYLNMVGRDVGWLGTLLTVLSYLLPPILSMKVFIGITEVRADRRANARTRSHLSALVGNHALAPSCNQPLWRNFFFQDYRSLSQPPRRWRSKEEGLMIRRYVLVWLT